MTWDEWIEMDSNFIPYHDRKVSELEKDLKAHVDYVDNEITRLACFEVLDELTQYLTHRYPEIFELGGNTIRNLVTGEDFPYPAGEWQSSRIWPMHLYFLTDIRLTANPTQAMATAAKLVQDDLVLMVENDGEQPYSVSLFESVAD